MAPAWLSADEPDEPTADASGMLEAQMPIVEVPSRSLDLWLLGAVLVLITVGTLEVFSSSAVYAFKKYGDSTFFLRRHVIYALVGLGAMAFASSNDYLWLKRRTYLLLLVSLALLAAALIMGAEINGARRWLRLGPLTFQPVEIAKLSLITYLAYSLSKKADKVKTFTVGFVPHLLVCAVMMLLLLRQPDLGSAMILGATTLVLLFIAGAKISYIMVAVLGAAPVGYYMIVGTPWRMRRFLAYLNPEAFADGAAYQLIQAQIAIGSGGPFGLGLGQGRQTLGYMPEGHSDFIMAGIGEELGFIGVALTLAAFSVLVWRGIRAARGARDVFGSYLAFGIALAFGLQALFNTGVVLGVLPNKGITLPFVSYGGSSLIVSMYLAGLLMAIGMRKPGRVRIKRQLVNVVAGAKRRRERAVIA